MKERKILEKGEQRRPKLFGIPWIKKWIVKTDEVRIENAPFYLESTEKWIKTEKLS